MGPGHTGNQQACPRGVTLSPGQGCQSHSPGTGDIKAFTTKVINSSVLFLSSPGAVLRANLRAIYLFTEYLLCLLRALLYFYAPLALTHAGAPRTRGTSAVIVPAESFQKGDTASACGPWALSPFPGRSESGTVQTLGLRWQVRSPARREPAGIRYI